jgi:hypothetical protein
MPRYLFDWGSVVHPVGDPSRSLIVVDRQCHNGANEYQLESDGPGEDWRTEDVLFADPPPRHVDRRRTCLERVLADDIIDVSAGDGPVLAREGTPERVEGGG